MRQFIRHPPNIPIEVRISPGSSYKTSPAKDVSHGGIAFVSDVAVEPGTTVELRIPCLKPMIELSAARVEWCRKQANRFIIGVRFTDLMETYRIRMVEQICHIESYRKYIQERHGRHLTVEDAAKEWINRYASSFPTFQETDKKGEIENNEGKS